MRKVALVVVLALLTTVIPSTVIPSTVFASDGHTPSGIPLADIEGFVDDYVAEYIGQTTPGAAVVLVQDGEIVFSKGYGYADVTGEIPVDPAGTIFEYGSATKLFVYTTIMRLVEAGKIDLHADVRQYLPDGFLRKLNYDQPITMLHIMSHTTGFEDFLFDVIMPTDKYLMSLEQAVEKLQPEQVYPPGAVSAYSNYAVSLAAYVAQRMVGQDFHAYVMEHILMPLGMEHASVHPTLLDRPALVADKATGYYPLGNGEFKLGSWSYLSLYPSGAANGTAEDLARFAMALMPEGSAQAGPLFANRETLDLMLTQSYAMGPGLTGFAHGFIEWDGQYPGVGHGGNTACFSTQINIVPSARFGVIVLTNAASEMDITSGLTEALIGKQDQTIAISSDPLPNASDVEGSYVSARRMHTGFLKLYAYLSLLQVRALDETHIELSAAGQRSVMVQTAPHVFQRVDADGPLFRYHFGTVYFEMQDGQVQRMSGDYQPVPSGHSPGWVAFDLVLLIISSIFFVVVSLLLIFRALRGCGKLPANLRSRTQLWAPVQGIIGSGAALVLNNGILLVRMLQNNYRSFAEVRPQIILNWPLAGLATLMLVLSAIKRPEATRSRGQTVFSLVTGLMLLALLYLLTKWQFFTIVA